MQTNNNYSRPMVVNYLKGNYNKAKETLNWEPKIKFKDLVKIMVEADLERWERWKKGEHFPWDAGNYPNENKIHSRKWKIDQY